MAAQEVSAARPLHVGVSLVALLPGASGGTETYVRGLLGGLADRAGRARTTVLANPLVMESYRDVARGAVALRSVPAYVPGRGARRRVLTLAVALAAPDRLTRSVPTDVVVLHYPFPVPLPAATAPTVVSLHDVQHHDFPQNFGRLERVYRSWAYDSAARQADRIITVSHDQRRRIETHLGIPGGRIEVIHNGIDHSRFDAIARDADEGLLAPFGLPPHFLLYPANFWPHKNHLRLIEALAQTSDDALGLVLTGQDLGRGTEIDHHGQRLGVASRVHRLGHVPSAVVPALLRRARALVFPSEYEGFGLPVLEAMACGCPVAAAGLPVFDEIAGGATVAFDPEDTAAIAAACDRVHGDEEARARLVTDGLRTAAGFTWAASASRHLEVYERVAG